jgi:hypothetical protein
VLGSIVPDALITNASKKAYANGNAGQIHMRVCRSVGDP